ncbi:MAG: ABC transporter permease [Streptosporangiaceae bacterium]
MSLAAAPRYPVWTGWRDTLRAEWSKLLTVPGPAWLLAAVVGLTVAVSAAADALTRCPAGTSCSVDTVKLSLTGIQLGQAVVAILAVLPVCNEYSTGMIRVTLAAMPRRPMVLAAKASVVTGLVLVSGAFAVLGSLVAGLLILPGHGFTTARGFTEVSLTHAPTLRAAAGSVLYLVLIAALSTGIAAMVRDSAVSIGLALGVLYVFPVLTAFIGNQTWHHRIERYTPMAGLNIQSTTDLRSLAIGPWGGLGVLALWAVGALLAGGLLLRLRDA